MKRPSLLSFLLIAVTVLAGATRLVGQGPDNAEQLFQRARTKAFVEGKLDEAIKLYAEIASTYKTNRAISARALVQMADCHEKLGQAQARDLYERIVREYADQAEAVSVARGRLAELGARSAEPSRRLVAKAGALLLFSPDRRWVMRLSPLGPQELRDQQTGKVRTVGTKGCFGFPFSRDSRQIAFQCSAGGTVELRVAAVEGGPERPVWRGGEPLGSLQWFPDGKRILGTEGQGGRMRLVAVSVLDGTIRTLGEVEDSYGSPQLSPDGKSVIYVPRTADHRAQTKLLIKSVADGKEATFFEWPSAIYSPVWTHDGTGVVFLSDRREPGKSADLWLLRVAGTVAAGIPALLARDVGGVDSLGRPRIWPLGPVTHDGAYYYGRDNGSPLHQTLLVPIDPQTGTATGPPSFVSARGGVSRSPSFSADGRWLSFVVDNKDLVVKSLQSGEERVVLISPAFAEITWAVMFPDGRSFLVTAVHPPDGQCMYRVDAASGSWTPVAKPGERSFRGWPDAISADGGTIYFNRWSDPANPLIARGIESGQERELRRGGRQLFALSPDGALIAISYPDGKDMVIDLVPLTGGSKREIYRAAGIELCPLTWMPDGRFLIIGPAQSATEKNTKAFLRLSVADGSLQPTGISVPQGPPSDFPLSLGTVRVSPDGKYVAYDARGKGANAGVEEWVLENFLPNAATRK